MCRQLSQWNNAFWLVLVLATVSFLFPRTAAAHLVEAIANLTGPGGASGTALVRLDLDLVNMQIQLSFGGLAGTSTSANIYAPPKSALPVQQVVPSFIGFPTGVTSGTYQRTLTMFRAADYDPTFLAAADTKIGQPVADALEAVHRALDGGTAVLRVQSTQFPGGALSGNLVAVPEPSSVALTSVLVGALSFRFLKKRQRKLVSKRLAG